MRPRSLCDKLNEFLTTGLANEVFLAIQTHLLADNWRRQSLGPVTAPGMGGLSR